MPDASRNALELNRKFLSEIAMRRVKNPNLSGLVVEGTSDRKFYEKFIHHSVCTVLPVGDKDRVVETLANAERITVRGLVGIVDGDSDHFLGKAPRHKDVFQTDATDVETMMFASPAFVQLFRECVLRDGDMRSSEVIKALAETTRGKLLSAAFPLGLIRCISARDGLGITFTDLVFNSFINHLTCVCDLEKCLNAVILLPRGGATNNVSLRQSLQGEVESHATANPWHVVRGHDLTRITAMCSESLLQRALSSLDVERSLRLAYDREEFRKTNIYVQVAEWSERNKPFVTWA